MSKDNNVLKYILGALGGYTLIGSLTSEPTASLYPITSGAFGDAFKTTSNKPVEGLTIGTITTSGAIYGGAYLFGSTSGAEYLFKINGKRVYKDNWDGNIFTELGDSNSVIDEKAQKVYDKYHKNHKPIEVSGILFENDEVKKEFYRILNSYDIKELYYHLRALEEILTELIEEEREEEKIKKLELK